MKYYYKFIPNDIVVWVHIPNYLFFPKRFVIEALDEKLRFQLLTDERYVKWFWEDSLEDLLDYLDNNSEYRKLSDDEVAKELMLLELRK